MAQQKTIELPSEISMSTKQMYLRTILLVLTYISMGVGGEMIGPTMGVLAHNTHVTFSGIASVLASGSAGGLFANMFCGVLQNFVNNYQDLMLCVALFLRGILASSTPFISSLILLCVVFFFQGVAGSFANVGGTNLLFKMWKTRVAAPFNMVHFGYGFGAILANLIVRPFLSNKNSYVNTNISSQMNSTLSTSISVPLNADIRVPYLTTGGLCLIISAGHLMFLIHGRNNRQDKVEKQHVEYAPVNTISSVPESPPDKMKYSQYSPVTCGRGYFGYGLSLSIIFIVYVFFVVGTDQTFVKFYFSYLKVDKFGISTNAASWSIILFWFSFSMGRLMGAIESVFIPVYICLIVAWCGGFAIAIMWIIYVWIIGLTSTSLFVLGSLTGFLIGPLFPLSFAWIHQKLNVTASLLAALLSGCGLGSLVLQKIGGFVMDRDPNHFPTLIATCVIVTIILYVISNMTIFFHERNLKNKQDPVINDTSLTTDKLNEEEQQMTIYLEGVNEAQ